MTSRLVALLGYPLGHSITPSIYGAAFPAMGLDAACEAWPTPPDRLAETVAMLHEERILGANVTIPHKEAIIGLLDELAPEARAIGAVNCIARVDGRLRGHNTDKYGFMRALMEAGFEPRGMRCTLLGAGGAARAVAYGLSQAGALVTVTGRSEERTKAAVVSMLVSFGPGSALSSVAWDAPAFPIACRTADLIVNCTPLGTAGSAGEGQTPVTAELISPTATCYDLVYNPATTAFLEEAKKARARTIGGLDMLIYQGAESIRLWTGLEAPAEIMRRAAKSALGFGAG